MNEINQIIIEGTVSNVSSESLNNGFNRVSFNLKNIHEFNWKNEKKQDISYFCCDQYVSNDTHEIVKNDTKVRVVGRLRQSRWTTKEDNKRTKIIIYVEHLENIP